MATTIITVSGPGGTITLEVLLITKMFTDLGWDVEVEDTHPYDSECFAGTELTADEITLTVRDKLQNFFDNFNDTVELDGGFGIQWSRTGVGFGSFYFRVMEDGSVQIDNETMSKEFIKKVLCQMVDEAVLDD